MAQAGIIKSLSGSAIVRTLQGQVRELKVGDIVHKNELIETSTASSLVISLSNGTTVNLDENDTFLIDETVLAEVEAYDAIFHDVEALQNALENGEDISGLEQETALGEVDEGFDYDVEYYTGDNASGDVETDLTGDEDTAIAINLNIDLTDSDGSETLGDITISGVPDGASLSTGIDNGDGSWTLTQDQLSGLSVTHHHGFG